MQNLLISIKCAVSITLPSSSKAKESTYTFSLLILSSLGLFTKNLYSTFNYLVANLKINHIFVK